MVSCSSWLRRLRSNLQDIDILVAAGGARAAGRAGARSSGPGGARFADARLRSSSLLLRKPVVGFGRAVGGLPGNDVVFAACKHIGGDVDLRELDPNLALRR